MTSLFGEEIADEPSKRKIDKAHPALPGTGPAGETCRTCAHYCRVNYHGKRWRKCGLLRDHWTHGPATDIRAADPACRLWKQEADAPLCKLSKRQREVFRLRGCAYTTHEIAAELRLGVKTVETHLAEIQRRLGLKNSLELTVMAAIWVRDQERPAQIA
jgi:DNA-binding NarL/FixJ family response regulator